MPDPHKRHTAQNARGLNDFVTKREAYAGTDRMLRAYMAAHIEQYHTPWYVRAWRTITRRGNA